MDAIYDCHLHTEFSADSETPVRDQLEKAISLGMKEIIMIMAANSVLTILR
jgi:histidinol phosphatase-like PHP family hydrolase